LSEFVKTPLTRGRKDDILCRPAGDGRPFRGKRNKKSENFSKKGLTRKARYDILKNAAGKKRGARKRARGGKSDLEN